MEATIYKYRILVQDQQVIPMPKGAKILTAEFQNNQLCIWAQVTPNNMPEDRIIEIYGTGNPFPLIGKRTYITTVMDDPHVWHIFEYHKTNL